MTSAVRRREILQSLRQGTVPTGNLDALAVGIDHLAATIDADLDTIVGRSATFKALRGEYGSGKTFCARWIQQRALSRGLAVAEVQISELETPLHRLETVYRRITESLRTPAFAPSAFRSVLDTWLYGVEEDAAAQTGAATATPEQVDVLLERRLATVAGMAPVYPMGIRGYRAALASGDGAAADGLAAWLAGQPHVSASVKRGAGIRGEIDHFLAMGFLRGLLELLRGARYPGLLLVIDEVETLQRTRSDVRDKALNALRQWIDELDSGHYPGLYLLITGTPAFFEGRMGVQQLPPLAQRLHTEFDDDPRFDNPRAPQVRLHGFTLERLREVGAKVRRLYVDGSTEPDRVETLVDVAYLSGLAEAVAGKLGGNVGVSPRLYLKKLVDVLDRVEQFPDFDPRRDYPLRVSASEMTDAERAACADEVEL